jgi:hypothetical protein
MFHAVSQIAEVSGFLVCLLRPKDLPSIVRLERKVASHHENDTRIRPHLHFQLTLQTVHKPCYKVNEGRVVLFVV